MISKKAGKFAQLAANLAECLLFDIGAKMRVAFFERPRGQRSRGTQSWRPDLSMWRRQQRRKHATNPGTPEDF